MATCKTLADGTVQYWLNGGLHNQGDQPAVISEDGSRWYRYGKLHRESDKPAIVCTDGARFWYVNGMLHREGDKPAVLNADGGQEWHVNGKLHREGDKPAVIYTDGVQEWWTRSCVARMKRVTDFRENSDRYALVQAVVRVGDVRGDAPRTLRALLTAAQVVRSTSYHVGHEYAFLVALFL